MKIPSWGAWVCCPVGWPGAASYSIVGRFIEILNKERFPGQAKNLARTGRPWYWVSVNKWPLRERFLPLFVVIAAIVAVPVMILSPSGLPRLRQLRQEKVTANDQIAGLEREIIELKEQVRRVKHDPTELERVARDEIGLVRRTEVVFQFSR